MSSDETALAAAYARVVEAALARAGEDAPAFLRAPHGALAGLGAPPAAGRPLDAVLDQLLDGVLPYGMRTDHPRFFAFIPSPASPLSRLGELAMSVANAHAGSALQSEGATAIERALIAFLGERAGFPETAGGLFVSGGSAANLAALVAARDAMLPEERRADGVAYVSSQTHSSIAKALRIIGVSDSQVRTVAVDADLRIDPKALSSAVAKDRAAGLTPFLVAASAGTTNTGAVDPLAPIADFCAAEKLWMHVDGAFGASVLLSRRRGLLAGIGRADSLSWDAHKWLFQTYGCGVLLVRDRRRLSDSFRIGSDYLRDGQNGDAEPNFWDLGPELTRPARATRLWLTLEAMGLDAVDAAIERGFLNAEAAERAVRAREGWVVASPAQMAIVAFRYASDGVSDEAADALNLAAAKAMLESGFAVVGTTRLAGRAVLRICCINPATTEADIEETIALLDAFAREATARTRPV